MLVEWTDFIEKAQKYLQGNTFMVKYVSWFASSMCDIPRHLSIYMYVIDSTFIARLPGR